MTPEAFSEKAAQAVDELSGQYQLLAQGTFGDGQFQSQVHFGNNTDGRAEFVLSVADTRPGSDAFGQQRFSPLTVKLGAVTFKDVQLPPFDESGSITVEDSE